MRVRTAKINRDGTRVFYVQSLDAKTPDVEYAVHYVRKPTRRFWHCTCGDFTNRQLVLGRHCKHIRLLKMWVRLAGGLSHIKGGQVFEFELDVKRRIREAISAVHRNTAGEEALRLGAKRRSRERR